MAGIRGRKDESGPPACFRIWLESNRTFNVLEQVDEGRPMKIRNIDDAEVFLRVIDAGSFSAAARELQRTPAAVSKQVARLEAALGTRLFERNTRRVRASDDGRRIAGHVRDALAQLARAEELADDSRQRLEGRVRSSAPAAFGHRHVSAALADFRDSHPGVRFELYLSDQVADLAGSDIDLAIRIGELPDSQLSARLLAPNPRVLVASPDYLRRRGTPRRPSDLRDHDCLLFAYPGTRHDTWRLQHGKRREDIAVHGPLRSDSGEALRQWCLAGMGISLRDHWNVSGDLARGDLLPVLPRWRPQASAIHAVRMHRQPVPRRISALIDYLAERWRVELAPPA
jgi:DNA-binding transcriptional LysR family regulator